VRSPRTLLTCLAVVLVAPLALPAAGFAQSNAELCEPPEPLVNCGPGNNRTSAGGGDKVPHHNGLNSKKGQRATRFWPKVSGILWQVVDPSRDPLKQRTKLGGPLNDELLGRHGTDILLGAGGHDILWGDWDPVANNSRQRDVLSGGPGNDWLYPSHGRSVVRGGTGADYVWAYYGKGTIDCGPGVDMARIRTNGAFRTRNCEHIRHFCAHGESKDGHCLSPTGRPVVSARRFG
jgi:hypothetical protein